MAKVDFEVRWRSYFSMPTQTVTSKAIDRVNRMLSDASTAPQMCEVETEDDIAGLISKACREIDEATTEASDIIEGLASDLKTHADLLEEMQDKFAEVLDEMGAAHVHKSDKTEVHDWVLHALAGEWYYYDLPDGDRAYIFPLEKDRVAVQLRFG